MIILKSLVLMLVVVTIVAYMVYAERKVLAYIQNRYGPNRVGPFGILQSIADAIKLVFKEEIIPKRADKFLYILAPGLTAICAFLPFAIIPLGKTPLIADIPISVLLVLAISSIGSYGIILGGWSSGSKYSLLGGMRSAAQIISYEIPLAIAVLGVIGQSGSFSLKEIVEQQNIPNIGPQFLGFLVFFIAGFAETNRTPFDLPEAESELVGGYNTEYSSVKFAWYFLGEYANILVISILLVTLYLGGYKGYFIPFPGIIVFILKVLAVIFIFFWVRGTLIRLRFDQLMEFSWKILLPLSLVNLLLTAFFKVF